MSKNYKITYDFNKCDVVDYWKDRIDWKRTNVGILDATEHCWRCGCRSNLQFCHIKPNSLGGEVHPSNIVLLCKACHEENPNIDDTYAMLNWLYSARKHNLFGLQGHYWVFRGIEECKKLYSFDLIEYLIKNCNTIDLDSIKDLISFYMNKSSIHWGYFHFNPATLGTILYNSFKNSSLKNKYYINMLTKLGSLPNGVGVNSYVFNKEVLSTNISAIDTVVDLLNYVVKQEKIYIKQRQAEGIKIAKERGKRFGRAKIEYPDNWEEVYQIWKSGVITAREAMRRTNIKPTSFYKLAKNYILKGDKEEQKC